MKNTVYESITCILEDNEGTRVEYEDVKGFTSKVDLGTNPSYWVITLKDGSTATFNMADWDLFIVRSTTRKEYNMFKG